MLLYYVSLHACSSYPLSDTLAPHLPPAARGNALADERRHWRSQMPWAGPTAPLHLSASPR